MHENKKICKGCGRNRKIGKFGKLSKNPDGKNIYCRDCMRIFRKRYRDSQKGKNVHLKTIVSWKKKNKKTIKEYNQQYYKKKKSIILYNKKARKDTESILIIEDSPKKSKKKINKGRDLYTIEINPKRKGDG